MERRYQVFVSSTYSDLTEERRKVIQALLELDCIPAGMELFPAADDDQWKLVQQVIDDCDYYIVIVAGRYGSLHADGISFTKKEYRYALGTKKPIIGFVHQDISKIESGKVEGEAAKKAKLEAFIELVKGKPVRFWSDAKDLGSQISRSLIKLIKSHPSSGWVRADNLPDQSAAQEILSLRQEIDRLTLELTTATVSPPSAAQDLAQGYDIYTVNFEVVWNMDYIEEEREGWNVGMPWNEIVFAIAPKLIDAATAEGLKDKLEEYIKQTKDFSQSQVASRSNDHDVRLIPSALDTIIIQLNALGIIRKSMRPRSVKDTNTYWELTPYGEKLMYEVRAIKRAPNAYFQGAATQSAE